MLCLVRCGFGIHTESMSKIFIISRNQDIIHAQYSFTKNRNGTGGTITLNNVSQNLRLITERINGWYNNLAERQQTYTRIKNAEIFKDFE